jgi:hypothetical protein
VVDEVVTVDRDRPELAGDRRLGADAEPDPRGLELAPDQAAEGLTARTYPVGEPGVGVDQTSAPSWAKRAGD